MTRIRDMDASRLAFNLRFEPSRTREGARTEGLYAIDLLGAVRNEASRRTPGTDGIMKIPKKKRTYEMQVPSLESTVVLSGEDGVLKLCIRRDVNQRTILHCSIGAAWHVPARLDFEAAAVLFLHAAAGAADPEHGDRARNRLLAHAAADVAGSARTSSLTGSMPWRTGFRSVDMFADGAHWSASMEWDGPMVADVSCVDTFSGTTLAVAPLTVTLREGDLEPIEMLRLIAELKNEP
jgi:hypothetical protein